MLYFKRAEVKLASDVLHDVREDELAGEGVASMIPGIIEAADERQEEAINIPQVHVKRTMLDYYPGTAASIPPIAATATTSAAIKTTTTPAAAPTAMNNV